MSLSSLLAVLVVAFPAAGALILGGAQLVGWTLGERPVTRVTQGALLSSFGSAVALGGCMALTGPHDVQASLGSWFDAGDYHFRVMLRVDLLALPLVILTTFLVGLVGHFSRSYLHREPGHARFHLLILVFASGMLTLLSAGSVDLLFAGWELVGLSSVLLIAFFHRRATPVNNGLYAYATYRACDVGLLVAAVLFHHYAGTATLDDAGRLPDFAATGVALLLLFASLGKSAQLPFSGWLPRAMEGPTPSSAIFYGGLSVHAGAYLLLRAEPVLSRSPLTEALIVVVGTATALYGTLVGRAQTDAKNQLAFATMAQVGLIFVEIGLGLRWLALAHIVGHALVRTLQFLRAPSLLHELHGIHAAAGSVRLQSGLHYEQLLSERVRRWWYAVALFRGGVEAAVMTLLVEPLLALARALERAERAWTAAPPGVDPGARPAPAETVPDAKVRR